MVGSTKVPLLRTVHLQQTKRGEVVNHLFHPGFYLSVNKPYLSVIEVDIRNDQGEVMLTLHFNRDVDCVTEPPPLAPITQYDMRRFHIQ